MQFLNSGKDPEAPLTAATHVELVGMGLAARRQGDLQGAVRILEAASTAAPENLDICVELGNTLRAMSRLDEAESEYRRVLDRLPAHFGALVGLAHVAKQRGDRPGALAHFEAAARADSA